LNIFNNWYQSNKVLKIKVSQLEQRSRTMEIFRLDKTIENEKLDLKMAMAQLNEAKEHLS